MYIPWLTNEMTLNNNIKKFSNNVVRPVPVAFSLNCELNDSFPKPQSEASPRCIKKFTQDLSTTDLLVLKKISANPSSSVFNVKKQLPSHIFQSWIEIYDLGDSVPYLGSERGEVV